MFERSIFHELVHAFEMSVELAERTEMLRILFFETPQQTVRLGLRIASDGHMPYLFPQLFSFLRLQESFSAKLPEDVGQDMKCTMLMHRMRQVITHRGTNACAPVRYNAWNPYLFTIEVAKEMIVAVTQFVAREKYPRKRPHRFCVKGDVKRERFPPDRKMFCIEHENANTRGRLEHGKRPHHNVFVLRPLDTTPRRRAAHAPSFA